MLREFAAVAASRLGVGLLHRFPRSLRKSSLPSIPAPADGSIPAGSFAAFRVHRYVRIPPLGGKLSAISLPRGAAQNSASRQAECHKPRACLLLRGWLRKRRCSSTRFAAAQSKHRRRATEGLRLLLSLARR